MYLARVGLWMIRRLLGSPVGWLWLVASLALLPLAAIMTPANLRGHASDQEALISQVAFLSGLCGASFAMATIGENDWILARAGAGKALLSRWVGTGACAALGAAAALSGGLYLHPFVITTSLLLAALLSTAHLAVVAGALLTAPGSLSSKVAALPLVTWALPAVLEPESSLGRGIAALLQAYREPGRFPDLAPGTWLPSVAPVIAIGAATLAFSLRNPATSPR
jgi:hypothetical protein